MLNGIRYRGLSLSRANDVRISAPQPHFSSFQRIIRIPGRIVVFPALPAGMYEQRTKGAARTRAVCGLLVAPWGFEPQFSP